MGWGDTCRERFPGCFFAFACVLPFCFAQAAGAQETIPKSLYEQQRQEQNRNTITIMGSQAVTAYTRFAEDMQNVLDDTNGNGGLRILPILGRGGGQNFLDILFLQGIDLGLVERDVVDTFKAKNPQLYGHIEDRLRYILKLSNSELHIFVRPGINKLEDLRGKKVSHWKELSSSDQALQKVFSACGIEDEKLYMDQDLGAQKLINGEIDAVGRISGAPHYAFSAFTSEHGHFLPLTEDTLPPGCFKKLLKDYLPARLRHEYYPKILAEGESVETIANATILATFNFPEKTERYQTIARFVNKLFDNIGKFRDPARHPKWEEVNIGAEVPGWTRFKAAQEWIDAHAHEQTASITPTADDVKSAFEQYLSERLGSAGQKSLTPEQKQALLEDFAKWWRTNNKGGGR